MTPPSAPLDPCLIRLFGPRQADSWLQIESTNLGVQLGYNGVQPGYSGGPAWDSDLGGVVGLITAARDARTG